MADFTQLHHKRRLVRSLPSPALRRSIREDAGLTQEDVATALGVSRAIVSRWEAGLRRPPGRRLTDYAQLLKELQSDG